MEEETTVAYNCTRGPLCHRLFGITVRPPSESCPDCEKVTTTKRSIPTCEKYWLGGWVEVFQIDGAKAGETSFYHGREYIEDGKTVQSIAEPVALHTDINACADQGRVRFFVKTP